MYDGLEDPFNHLMHFLQVITLQNGNDALLWKVFLSDFVEPTLSLFHRLLPNTITSFRALSKKFVTQYMCSIRRKQASPRDLQKARSPRPALGPARWALAQPKPERPKPVKGRAGPWASFQARPGPVGRPESWAFMPAQRPV